MAKRKDQLVKVGSRQYEKLGEVSLDLSSEDKDFVSLEEIMSLVPEDAERSKIFILGNRLGVQVYKIC